MPNEFPAYSGYGLTRDQVVSYLLEVKGAGHPVFQEQQGFVIHAGDWPIFIHPAGAGWTVNMVGPRGNPSPYGTAYNRTQLADFVRYVADGYGSKNWPSAPVSGRVYESTPASNYRTISALIGAAEVQAVFDPYLDNAALSVLLDVLSFGGSVADNLRLLSSENMAKGAVPRLSKSYVDQWFTERGVKAGEARLMGSEHRRFLLLAGGKSLILGCSLNSVVTKNEAVRIEDDKEDRAFFDTVWATAKPL